MAIETALNRKTPWHLWVCGGLAMLWYFAGAFTILMAQAGKWPGMRPDELAYYAAQPRWFVLSTNLVLANAIAGSLALLMRRRSAVWFYAITLVLLLANNLYELANGSSRAYANRGAMIATIAIVIIAVLLLRYARGMRRRGLLR
jgi:hypothetical protein